MSAKKQGGGGKGHKPAPNAPKSTRRGTRPGSIRQLRLRLWWAVDEATRLLDEPEADMKLKAIHAMSTAAGVYGRLTELHTVEAELAVMQRELNELKQALNRPTGRHASPSAGAVN